MDIKAPRKKPVRLQWSGEIIDSAPTENSKKIEVGSPKQVPNVAPTVAQPIAGTVKVRRESKGRAGKPVTYLFEFSDPAAQSHVNLKQFLSKLKTHLACGGALEQNGIIVQVDNVERVLTALRKFGIEGKKSGG